jgi:hypothetical protein
MESRFDERRVSMQGEPAPIGRWRLSGVARAAAAALVGAPIDADTERNMEAEPSDGTPDWLIELDDHEGAAEFALALDGDMGEMLRARIGPGDDGEIDPPGRARPHATRGPATRTNTYTQRRQGCTKTRP